MLQKLHQRDLGRDASVEAADENVSHNIIVHALQQALYGFRFKSGAGHPASHRYRYVTVYPSAKSSKRLASCKKLIMLIPLDANGAPRTLFVSEGS